MGGMQLAQKTLDLRPHRPRCIPRLEPTLADAYRTVGGERQVGRVGTKGLGTWTPPLRQWPSTCRFLVVYPALIQVYTKPFWSGF